MQTIFRMIALVSIVQTLVGCNGHGQNVGLDSPTGIGDFQERDGGENTRSSQTHKHDFEVNRLIWEQKKISDYTYSYDATWMLVDDIRTTVIVKDSEVDSAFYTPSGEYLHENELQSAKTIDELFDLLQKGLQDAEVNPRYSVTNLRYNKEFGYPESFTLALDRGAADQIVHYSAMDLR